jgi:hypothetical protein
VKGLEWEEGGEEEGLGFKAEKPRICPLCEEQYEWGLLGRTYLDLVKDKVRFQARLRYMEEGTEPYRIMAENFSKFKTLLNRFLRDLKPGLREHPLWEWCQATKGLKYVGALTFISYIRTHVHGKDGSYREIDTAGKVKAYFGLIPGVRLRSGERVKINVEAKGRLLGVIVPNVIRARDPYYKGIYNMKKQYLLDREFNKYIEDPSLCPRYEECRRRLMEKAARLGRKPKKSPCKGHVDSMAKRFLGEILVSHAGQLIREGMGLSVGHFKSHRDYLPPKTQAYAGLRWMGYTWDGGRWVKG